MGIKIAPCSEKLKKAALRPLNFVLTNSHLDGTFSNTAESLAIRRVSKLEKAGNMNEIKNVFSAIYDKMLKMDEEFKKLLPTFTPKKYFRGIIGSDNEGVKILQKAKIGEKVVPDSGYSFITKSRKIADGYARYTDNSANGSNVLMEIKIPAGAKISRNPFHLKEAVLPRNAAYEVAAKKENDGLLEVVLKYIKPSK